MDKVPDIFASIELLIHSESSIKYFIIFTVDEPGQATVRKLIEGIKQKKDTHELLGNLYEIAASEKSYYANDELIGKPRS